MDYLHVQADKPWYNYYLIASSPAAIFHIVCTNYVDGINVLYASGVGLTSISLYYSLGDSQVRLFEQNTLWLPIMEKRDCNEIRTLHVDAFVVRCGA